MEHREGISEEVWQLRWGYISPQVDLLQSWLARVLDSFLRPEPQDLLGLMEVVGIILHHLGLHGVGAVSLKIAQHLRTLFDDVRPHVCTTPHPGPPITTAEAAAGPVSQACGLSPPAGGGARREPGPRKERFLKGSRLSWK